MKSSGKRSIKQLKTKFPNVRKWLNYLILYKATRKKTLLREIRSNQFLTHLTQKTVFIKSERQNITCFAIIQEVPDTRAPENLFPTYRN